MRARPVVVRAGQSVVGSRARCLVSVAPARAHLPGALGWWGRTPMGEDAGGTSRGRRLRAGHRGTESQSPSIEGRAPYETEEPVKVKLKPLASQVVVVVGASSGIGRETAIRLAARGAKVVAAARSEPGLISLVAEITAHGGEATYVAEVDQVAAAPTGRPRPGRRAHRRPSRALPGTAERPRRRGEQQAVNEGPDYGTSVHELLAGRGAGHPRVSAGRAGARARPGSGRSTGAMWGRPRRRSARPGRPPDAAGRRQAG